jgi:hypothetical protein
MPQIAAYKLIDPYFRELRKTHRTIFFKEDGTENLGPDTLAIAKDLVDQLKANIAKADYHCSLSMIVGDMIRRSLNRHPRKHQIPYNLPLTLAREFLDPEALAKQTDDRYAALLEGVTPEMCLSANRVISITQPLWLQAEALNHRFSEGRLVGSGSKQKRTRELIYDEVKAFCLDKKGTMTDNKRADKSS